MCIADYLKAKSMARLAVRLAVEHHAPLQIEQQSLACQLWMVPRELLQKIAVLTSYTTACTGQSSSYLELLRDQLLFLH